MSVAYLDIKKWGNSLGVRIPATIARQARFKENQRVRIEVEGDRVTITPANADFMTLEERLNVFDPNQQGGEVMVSKSIGAEVWE